MEKVEKDQVWLLQYQSMIRGKKTMSHVDLFWSREEEDTNKDSLDLETMSLIMIHGLILRGIH